MASIQQALNQMLATAGVAAGLYAHSPKGQSKTEFKQTKKAYDFLEEKRSQWEAPLDTSGLEMADELSELQLARAKKLYELDPTEENYKEWMDNLNRARPETKYAVPNKTSPKAKAEAKAMASLKEKQDTRTQLEKEIKERRGEYMKEVAQSRAAAAAEINKFSGGKK